MCDSVTTIFGRVNPCGATHKNYIKYCERVFSFLGKSTYFDHLYSSSGLFLNQNHQNGTQYLTCYYCDFSRQFEDESNDILKQHSESECLHIFFIFLRESSSNIIFNSCKYHPATRSTLHSSDCQHFITCLQCFINTVMLSEEAPKCALCSQQIVSVEASYP